MSPIEDKSRPWSVAAFPLVLVALGAVLIAASFFPVGYLASEVLWTDADSAAYDRLTTQYKRSAYQTAARAGVTDDEWQAQRERMKQKLDAMNAKLEQARSQPKLWSRCFFLSGALLTASGTIWHRNRIG